MWFPQYLVKEKTTINRHYDGAISRRSGVSQPSKSSITAAARDVLHHDSGISGQDFMQSQRS
jgi:hypothetical protein